MLQAFTWTQFFSFLGMCLIVYYVFVFFFYFRPQLNSNFLKGNESNIQSNPQHPATTTFNSVSTPPVDYSRYTPPVQTEVYKLNEDQESDISSPEDLAAIPDTDIIRKDEYDWEDSKAFIMDYREPKGEELSLLNGIEVNAEGFHDTIDGGIQADDYLIASDEILKDQVEEGKKELTKSVLRRAYFNTSYVEMHQMNINAKNNMDDMLLELKKEGKISENEISSFNQYLMAENSEDEDVRALLETLNS